MKRYAVIFLYLTLAATLCGVQFRVMTYNSLNFNGEDADRAACFGRIVQEVDPHILIMQEMINQNGVDTMLEAISEEPGDYAAAQFYNGYDTDNILFYKPFAVTLVDQGYIPTDLREFGEYELEVYGEPLRIYSCHLKASQGYANQRLGEVTVLRNHLNGMPAGTEFIVGGDMNIYGASEPGYQKFIANESDNDGRCFDPSDAGEWHNSGSFSYLHTQSTRDVQVGGGATGGLDDRFDFLFLSYGMNDGDGVEYVQNSYTPFGNDGDHFNDAINEGSNGVVSAQTADALFNASDHLPVFADFTSQGDVDLELLAYRVEDARGPLLSWITREEDDLLGFNVLWGMTSDINDAQVNSQLIPAQNSAGENYYSFGPSASYGYNYYWLEMVGADGSTATSNALRYYSTPVDDTNTPAVAVSLGQNYPNPFNPSTTIEYSVSAPCNVELAVYNLRGQRVATLEQGGVEAGKHRVIWNGQNSYGATVASGVYMYRLTAGDKVSFRKMVLTK